jgi:hypothetical protein
MSRKPISYILRDEDLDLLPVLSDKPMDKDQYNRHCLKVQVRVKAVLEAFLTDNNI